MVTIDAFRPADLAALIQFVEAIQEHERTGVPDLKSGSEIGSDYAQMMVRTAAEKNGCIRMARAKTVTVGFGCAWIEEDMDPCLRDDARTYAYISDLFVEGAWRRQGVALGLLEALELEMRAPRVHPDAHLLEGCQSSRISLLQKSRIPAVRDRIDKAAPRLSGLSFQHGLRGSSRDRIDLISPSAPSTRRTMEIGDIHQEGTTNVQ
jgi:GNAT superfamily N-acetyltransferase